MDLALAVWNLHRGRGADGRIDPARTLAAILSQPDLARADVLALHEADGERPPYPPFLDLAALEAATGLRSVHRTAGLREGAGSHGFRGNILLLRPGIGLAAVEVHALGGVCPRGAVVARLAAGPVIVAAHLSLAQGFRIAQMRRLRPALAGQAPVVVIGDLNEWRPWGGLALSRAVTGRALRGEVRATFPAARPVLPLDRILCDRPGALTGVRALRDPALVAASDHLPLVARLSLAPGPATSG